MQSELAYPVFPIPQESPEIRVVEPASRKAAIHTIAFALVHLAGLAAFITGVSWKAILLCVGSYVIRMIAITMGYHRYFSHKTFKAGRFVQFALGWMACTSAQKGPLWWAAHHRVHHQNSDLPADVHSPTRDGFWWSHVGWILSTKYDETNLKLVPDLARYPELLWLKYHLVPPFLWAIACYLIGDMQGLIWGFFISTTILWHSTFMINSAAHLFGGRRFPTKDTSRNNIWLALLTMGEGWHNNHHFYPSSANQGFYWWEVDVCYYVLKGMEKLKLVSEVRRPPQRVLDYGRNGVKRPRSAEAA